MATCWGGSAQQLRQLGEVRRHPLPSAPILVGDPSRPLLWQEVDTLLREQITTATGHRLPIRAACVDSGGHHALRVYDFVRDKGNRSIWAIKGSSMPGVPP